MKINKAKFNSILFSDNETTLSPPFSHLLDGTPKKFMDSPTEALEIIKNGRFCYKPVNKHHDDFILKNIEKRILSLIPINSSAIAYRKKHSYLDFIAPHVNSNKFLRLDIASFFHSIDISLVKEVFSEYLSNEHFDSNDDDKIEIIDVFCNLVMYKVPPESKNTKFIGKTILPAGFPTSPTISNIIFRRIDILIEKFCSSREITYTRYADDMLFSSINCEYIFSSSFEREISIYLRCFNFRINKQKTIRENNLLCLNGFIVDGNTNKIRISSSKVSEIKKIIHHILKKQSSPVLIMNKYFHFNDGLKIIKFNARKVEFIHEYCIDQLINKLAGYRTFLLSFFVYQKSNHCVCDNFLYKTKQLIGEIEKSINCLSNIR